MAEHVAGFTITGDTDSEGGVSVTVTVGTTELTATSSATSTPAAWSVSVPPNAAYIIQPSVTITVSASKTGFAAPADVTHKLAVDLTAPTPSYTAPGALLVGVAITNMTASTTATDIASYGASGLPSGLNIDTGTGVISGTPDMADTNPATATVTVTDSAGNFADASITFPVVDKGDQKLADFSYNPDTVTFGSAAPPVAAPNGALSPLSYSATPATVCRVDSSTGALTLLAVGKCEVTVTAESSTNYNEATAEFTVTVESAGTLALNVDAIAGDDTVNIAEHGAGFTIDGDTGSEGGVSVTVTVGAIALTATSSATSTPATWSVNVPANAGYITESIDTVTVSASKAGFTAPTDVKLTLTVDLTAPTVAWTPPATLQVGVALDALMPVTDDTDIETWEATGLPPGLAIDADGTVSGTPTAANAANATATVTVTDTAGNPGTATIIFPAVTVPPALALTVGAIAGDNTVNIAEKAAGFAISGDTGPNGGATVTVTVGGTALSTTSADADPATWSVQVPADATALAEGDVTVTVDATKAGYTPATRVARTLTVDLSAPTVAYTPPGTLQVGVAIDALTPDTDDTDIASWSATGLPPGLAIAADGTVSGTPTAANAANATATVTVTDTAGNPGTATIIFPAVTEPPALALTVGAIAGDNTVNIAEKAAGFAISGDTGPIGGAAVTVTVGSTELSATSTDADPATWSVQVPADAAYIVEGDLSVTVDATKAGYTPATRVARTLTVDLTAPTVAWTPPATLQVGVALDALMPVTDDTDIETWEATGLPPGLAIDADGTVSGTPTAANAANATATVTVTDTAGNPGTATIIFPAVTVPPALALTVGAIAGDNTVNIAEKAAGFAISGDTGPIGGAAVTVTVGSTELSATSTDADPATWSVQVPADATALAEGDVTVTVDATKAGYTPATRVARTLTVDLTAPTVAWTPPATLQVGVALDALMPVTDDTDIETWEATGLPPGLAIDADGTVSGTPTAANAANATATVTVTDTAGNPVHRHDHR